VNSIDLDSAAAKGHPLIKEFVSLVDETVGEGVLDFSHLRQRPFMKFWQHFIIYRYEQDIDDFRVKLYGTHVVKMYGVDWTGKLMSEIGFADAYDDIYKMNMKAMSDRNRIYASGSLFWQNRETRSWHSVKIPLSRNNDLNEILILMDIE